MRLFSMSSANASARLFDENRVPAFYCDKQLKILKYNSLFADKYSLPSTELKTPIVLGLDEQNLKQALTELANGSPYYSTNFTLFQQINLSALLFLDNNSDNLLGIVMPLEEGANLLSPHVTQCALDVMDSYRSPVSEILNALKYLQVKFESFFDILPENEYTSAINMISSSNSSCYKILRKASQFCDYVRLAEHKMPIKLENININAWFNELKISLENMFSATAFKLFFIADETPVVSSIDSELLSEAVFQLIANACLYSSDNKDITISLNVRNDSYSITVLNYGYGISPNNIEKAFAPFQTVENLEKHEMFGLGLGLTITKEIAALFNGNVFVNSSEGSDISVTITLPISLNSEIDDLAFKSYSKKYVVDRFSKSFILLSEICENSRKM